MFTLDPADKITTGEELDRIIRADIPDPETKTACQSDIFLQK